MGFFIFPLWTISGTFCSAPRPPDLIPAVGSAPIQHIVLGVDDDEDDEDEEDEEDE